MTVEKTCPFCMTVSSVEVDEEQYEAYNRGLNIIQAFPKLSLFERELLISGMCFGCQERTFHKPLPQHAEEWGELVGNCECCGAGLYEKMDRGEDGLYHCSCCGESYGREELSAG